MTVPVQISMDEADFGSLTQNSMRWADGAEGWTERIRDGHFEVHGTPGTPPSMDWAMTYWLGNEYTSVILARAFLAARGFACQVIIDLATGPEWMILTDYDRWRAGK